VQLVQLVQLALKHDLLQKTAQRQQKQRWVAPGAGARMKPMTPPSTQATVHQVCLAWSKVAADAEAASEPRPVSSSPRRPGCHALRPASASTSSMS